MAAINTAPSDPGKRSLLEKIFVSPAEARLRAGWRLLLQFFLLIFFITAFGILAFVLGLDLTALQSRVLLPVYLIPTAGVIASVYFSRRLFDRRTFVSLGLRVNRTALKDLAVGTLTAGAIFLLITLILWAAGWLTINGSAWQTQSWAALYLGTGRAFILYILVALSEEIWNRGYILQNLEDGLNTAWAVMLSSLVFSLSHLGNPNASLPAVLGIFAGGLFLAYAYLRTRSLWLPIGVHLGWNFFEGVIFGYPVSGMNLGPRLLQHSVNGPAWLTGGAFGPEAGLVLLPGLLLGAWMLARYTRERRVTAA